MHRDRLTFSIFILIWLALVLIPMLCAIFDVGAGNSLGAAMRRVVGHITASGTAEVPRGVTP